VRLCGKRVGKEDDQVDPSFHNLRADLLVTTQGATVIALYGKTCLIRDHPSRCSGAAENMLFQSGLMFDAPFDQCMLFVVMSNECDAFFLFQCECNKVI